MSSDREDEGILWVWNFRIQDFWGLENWWPDLSEGFYILLFLGGGGGGIKTIWSAYEHSISIVYRLSLFIVFCDF